MNIRNFSKVIVKGIGITLIGSINAFVVSPVLSQQAGCSNYWVNPNTGLQECFGFGGNSIPPINTNTPSNSNNYSSDDSSRSSSTKPCAGLKLNIKEFSPSAGGAFTKVFGTVKNSGNQTYRYIEINIQYLANNKIIDDGFALVNPGVITPGETGTWSDFTTDDRVTKVQTTSMTCKLA
jgi:hypothetical protein